MVTDQDFEDLANQILTYQSAPYNRAVFLRYGMCFCSVLGLTHIAYSAGNEVSQIFEREVLLAEVAL